jgi:MGT family glycosyltransferase
LLAPFYCMRFLFCSLASHGYVYPAIGLAQVLQKQGHEVALVTGPAFRETIAQAGLERIPCGEWDDQSFQVAQWAHPIAGAIQIKHIKYAAERFAPDVLVGHPLTLGPLVAAELFSLPVAILGFATYLWPFSGDLAESGSAGAGRRIWRHQDMMQYYNQLRAQSRLPVIDDPQPATSPFLGDLFLLQNVPEFLQGRAEELPDRVRLVGSCLWDPPQCDPELEEWLAEALASGEPILYVQHGSAFKYPSFLPALIHAVKGWPIRVAVSVGRMRSKAPPAPSNFFIRDHVSQGFVLRHAQAVVSSGNTTVVLGAVTHGLPSLLMPTGGEQFDLAELCQQAGVALCLSPDEVLSYTVREALQKVLADSHLAQASRSLQAAFQRYGGAERAAELLSATFSKVAG